MTETFANRPLLDLSTMINICQERILLCGPCDNLMSEDEYLARKVRLYNLATAWTEEERTDFWYTLDTLCAEGNPTIRATPGLRMTPETIAAEDTRINRLAATLMEPHEGPQGFPVWGFYLYTDPVMYSLTDEERSRYVMARYPIVP